MADYIGITEAQSNPFAPLTSELVKQLRDNPIAIAEGAEGAPRVLPAALDGFYIGAISGTDSFVGFTNIDSDRLIRVDFSGLIYSTTFTSSLQARLTSDGGSSWTAAQDISATVSSITDGRAALHGTMFLDMSTGSYQSGSVSDIRLSPFLNTLTKSGSFDGSDFNGIQLRFSVSTQAFQASLTYMGVPHGL